MSERVVTPILLALVLLPFAAAAQEASRRTPVVAAAERVSPAVVNISAESTVREVDPFFGVFFGPSRPTQALGSGLIVDRNGIVVTNAHVIEGASRIVVTTLEGREMEADVLGSDRDSDLAVLKVKAGGLPAVPLGRSNDLLIGETVIAIGNPFGLSHTVTSGVLSARGRSVPSENSGQVFSDFLQTDASINPGNSGGPLVNIEGEVIGINTAIIQGATGIGFAIPADRARRVVEDLLRYGEMVPLWSGLRLQTLDPELAQRSGLAERRGALVLRVYPDSPAVKAGLAENDVVVAVNGQPVAHREDVTTALYTTAVGSPVRLDVKRAGRVLQVSLSAVRPPEGLGLRFLESSVGLTVNAGRQGLVIRTVGEGSPADRRGLRPGDVLLGANGQELGSAETLSREVLRGIERGGILLAVGRGRGIYNLEFPL